MGRWQSMEKISLQWELTTSYNSVDHHIMRMPYLFFDIKRSLLFLIRFMASITDQGIAPEAVYIDIPDNEWMTLWHSFYGGLLTPNRDL